VYALARGDAEDALLRYADFLALNASPTLGTDTARSLRRGHQETLRVAALALGAAKRELDTAHENALATRDDGSVRA
jgi:hypothetical protein